MGSRDVFLIQNKICKIETRSLNQSYIIGVISTYNDKIETNLFKHDIFCIYKETVNNNDKTHIVLI